jgi:phage gp36-like protein
MNYLTLAALRGLMPGDWLEKGFGTPRVKDAEGATAYTPVTDEQVGPLIVAASAEIDAYLGAAYALPFASPPAALEQVCASIVRYRLADEAADGPTVKRYQEAIAFLKRAAEGKTYLGQPAQGGATVQGYQAPTSVSRAILESWGL